MSAIIHSYLILLTIHCIQSLTLPHCILLPLLRINNPIIALKFPADINLQQNGIKNLNTFSYILSTHPIRKEILTSKIVIRTRFNPTPLPFSDSLINLSTRLFHHSSNPQMIILILKLIRHLIQ